MAQHHLTHPWKHTDVPAVHAPCSLSVTHPQRWTSTAL